jgi:ankyrin repeat protein
VVNQAASQPWGSEELSRTPRSNEFSHIFLPAPELLHNLQTSTWLCGLSSHLWLSGIPGAGKTVLSGLIIEECMNRTTAERAVAFFYCDYRSPNSQNVVNILGSIASQLARQNENSFKQLSKYHRTLHPQHQLKQSPEIEQLIQLLRYLSSTFEDVWIVVDGLDECGSSTVDVLETFPEQARLQYLNKKAKGYVNPLIQQAINGNVEVMLGSILAGADLEVCDPALGTALKISCHSGKLSAVKFLVRQGAKLECNIKNHVVTALQAASGYPDIIHCLLVNQHLDQGKLMNNLFNSEHEPEVRP